MQCVALIMWARFFFLLFCFTQISISQATTIDVGMIVGFEGNPSVRRIQQCAVDGMRVAMHRVNARGGLRGRHVALHTEENGFNEATVPLAMGRLIGRVPGITTIFGILGDGQVFAAARAAPVFNITIFGPVVIGAALLRYSQSLVFVRMDPYAELLSLVRRLVNDLQLKRIGIMTTVDSPILPLQVSDLQRQLDVYGLNVTGAFRIPYLYQNITNATSGPWILSAELAAFYAARPQAVICAPVPSPSGTAFMASILSHNNDPSQTPIVVALSSAGVEDFFTAFALNPRAGPNGHVIAALAAPSPLDRRYAAVRQMEQDWTAASAAGTVNLTFAEIQADGSLGLSCSSAYLLGTLLMNIFAAMPQVTRARFNEFVFDFGLFAVADWVFGIYSKPCEPGETTYCSCNQGARSLDLGLVTNRGTMDTIPGTTFNLPLEQCNANSLVNPSPLTVLQLSDGGAMSVGRDLRGGFSAGILRANVRVPLFINYTAAPNATFDASLADATSNRHVVAVVLSQYVPPLTTVDSTFVVDPLPTMPRLYTGYRDGVVHITSTLQQDIFVAAKYASTLGRPLEVVSFSGEGALRETVALSVATFGVRLGRTMYGVSVGTTLAGLSDVIGAALVIGLRDDVDANETRLFLRRNVNATVILTTVDALRHFERLMPADEFLGRLLVSTSIPNWAEGALSQQAPRLLSEYNEEVERGLRRSPASMLGFINAHAVPLVADLVRGPLSWNSFRDAWFELSIISVEDLVLGPYIEQSEANCGPLTCGVNTGARTVSIIALTNAALPARLADSLDRFTFDTLSIPYRVQSESILKHIPLIVTAIGSILVIAIIIVVALILDADQSVRSNHHAPKDAESPVALLITDIQSSTALWARIPLTMTESLEDHHRIVRALIEEFRGYEVKTVGDAFIVAFRSSDSAVRMAVKLQQELYKHTWPWDPSDIELGKPGHIGSRLSVIDEIYCSLEGSTVDPEEYSKIWNGLRVRIGIHVGKCSIQYDTVAKGFNYSGPTVRAAMELCNTTIGGQILLSQAARQSLADTAALGMSRVGRHTDLKVVYEVHAIEGRGHLGKSRTQQSPIRRCLSNGVFSGRWATAVESCINVSLGTPHKSNDDRGNVYASLGRVWQADQTGVNKRHEDLVAYLSNVLGPIVERRVTDDVRHDLGDARRRRIRDSLMSR